MNSYELLQKLTDGRCEIYLPKAQVALDPMECDDRIQWNSGKDEYMRSSFKMSPKSLVISLMEKAYQTGIHEGERRQAHEIKKAFRFLKD